MKNDELLFLPLGGCREIGMNLNAYGYGPPEARRWLIVDIGVTFADDRLPGVDLILPDPTFLEERQEEIDGILVTHAHEDHIGAIGWLWPRLRAPIYATAFTAYLVREKLREHGLEDQAEIHVLDLGERRKIGVFDIELISLTHSIPEPNGVAIRTGVGTILHTGDWKLDPDPVVGADYDQAKLEQLGRDGILAMVCDSTNVFEEGESGSESAVAANLVKLIGEKQGKVVVTSFASNVARLHSVCTAARASGRRVCLVGRSMLRIVGAAQSVGLLTEFDFIEPDSVASLPDSQVLYLSTGSQGEPNAALSRIARGEHQHVRLGEGDTVFFSSRVIPGNERSVSEVQNMLAERGVELVTERTAHIHVSGHPCRDELRQVYQWTRPKIAIPVHGERRHLIEHARLARSMQLPFAITPTNGEMVKLGPGKPSIVDEVPAGRLHVEGSIIVPADAESLRERRRIAGAGYVWVSIVFDGGKLADGAEVFARGLSEPSGDVADESLGSVDQAVDSALERLSSNERREDATVERAIVRAVRRACEMTFGKRPLVDVAIHRI